MDCANSFSALRRLPECHYCVTWRALYGGEQAFFKKCWAIVGQAACTAFQKHGAMSWRLSAWRLKRSRKRHEASFRPSARLRSIRLRMNFARLAVLAETARNCGRALRRASATIRLEGRTPDRQVRNYRPLATSKASITQIHGHGHGISASSP